jgi:undecaprenyl-diphosphatase
MGSARAPGICAAVMSVLSAGPYLRLLCPIASLLLFGGLASAVSLGLTDSFDAFVRTELNHWANPLLTRLAIGLSFIGSPGFLTPLTGVTGATLWWLGRSRSALVLASTFAAALILNITIKAFFLRARPEAFFGTLPDSYSFASGHALFSGCYYGLTAIIVTAEAQKSVRAWIWGAAILIIASVGLSRIYLSVHHATDVLAGFALASFLVCTARSLFCRSDGGSDAARPTYDKPSSSD